MCDLSQGEISKRCFYSALEEGEGSSTKKRLYSVAYPRDMLQAHLTGHLFATCHIKFSMASMGYPN
jgi:hypothetical protein